MIGRHDDPLRRLADQVQAALNQQGKRVHALEQHAEQISKYLSSRHAASDADQTMADLQRREEHYAQVIMLAGYGAFFALWTQTRSEMSLWMFASTGTLICISLIAFVGFELYKSWRMGRFFSSKRAPDVREVNQQVDLINKHWHIAFIVSSSTGLIAGLSLFLWFVYKTIIAAAALSGST